MLGLHLILECKLGLLLSLLNLFRLLLVFLVQVVQTSVQLEYLLILQFLVQVEVSARHEVNVSQL